MAEPILQMIFQDRILETIKIVKDITTIGRMTDNDVVINNLGVSRYHCRIVKDTAGGDFFVEDLGSANGIKVNGVQVPKSPLHNGDEILIGKHKLVFQIAGKGVAGIFKQEESKSVDARAFDRTMFAPGAPVPVPPAAPIPEPSPPVAESEPPAQPASGPAEHVVGQPSESMSEAMHDMEFRREELPISEKPEEPLFR